MRRSSISLLVVLVFSIAGHADEVENVAIVKGMVEAINDRSLDRLDQYVSSTLVRRSAATPDVLINSLDEFKEFLRADFSAVPDSVISINIIFGNDEHVGLRAIYAGTQTGPMGPFAPKGNFVELPFMSILKIEDGKIQQMWVEWDNIYMLTQLGHFPPVGEGPE